MRVAVTPAMATAKGDSDVARAAGGDAVRSEAIHSESVPGLRVDKEDTVAPSSRHHHPPGAASPLRHHALVTRTSTVWCDN